MVKFGISGLIPFFIAYGLVMACVLLIFAKTTDSPKAKSEHSSQQDQSNPAKQSAQSEQPSQPNQQSQPSQPSQKQPKSKKITSLSHPSLLRKLLAKIHLWNAQRKWQNSSRRIPAMSRRFKRWSKKNPDLSETIQVVLQQMRQLAVDHRVFEAVLKDSEFGYKGQDSRKIFDLTASQIRQNFSDIYNLMLLAGADEGQATLGTIDQKALAWELNSNRTKLALLSSLNTQIVRLVNQIDGVHDNAITEAEIKALAQLNEMRFNAASGFVAQSNFAEQSGPTNRNPTSQSDPTFDAIASALSRSFSPTTSPGATTQPDSSANSDTVSSTP